MVMAAAMFGYGFSGAGEGMEQASSFSFRGMLSFELRQTTLWELDVQTHVIGARLGWSLKF
jgi:hypothetical protein